MKQRVINGNSLEFYNSDNSKKGEIKISGSDVIINPIDSNGTVIFGEEGTINDIEVGASGTPVDFTFLGGGTITPNGGTLTLGNSGDTIDLSNATIGTITASIFKGGQFIGDGSGLTGTPSTFTNITASGDISASGTITGLTGSFTKGIINLPSAAANEKIFQVQKAGSDVFYVDEDGDGVFSGIVQFKNFAYGSNGNTFIGGRQDLVLGMNWNNDTAGTSIKFTKDEFNNSPSNTLMLISSSGNVGIGTTSPLGLFQLDEYTVASQGANTAFGVSSIFANSGATGLYIGVKNAAYPNRGYGFKVTTAGVNSDFTIVEHGLSGDRFTIKTGGRVGIGTSSPYAKLHLSGSDSTESALRQSRAGVRIWDQAIDSSGRLQWGYRSTEGGGRTVVFSLANSSNNNVGIGTGAPGEALEVVGDISASADIHSQRNIFPGTNNRVDGSTAGTVKIVTSGVETATFVGTTSTLRNPNISNTISLSGTKIVDSDRSLQNINHITASGNISASGDLTANGFNTIGNISFTGTTNNEINSIVNLTLNADSDSNSGDAYRNIIFENRGAETARINKDGHLGIGNSNPTAAKLVIREDSSYGLRLEDATGHYFRVNTGGDTEIRGDVTVGGTLTAQEFHTEFVSASILFESGSTKFGDTSDDTHQFTGSIFVSSSGTIGPNSDAGIEFGDGTHGNEPADITIFTDTNGEIHLKRAGSNKISIQDNGIDIDEELHVRDGSFNNAIILSQNGHITASGNITLGNNKKITFGDSSGNTGTAISYDTNALFKINQANSGELRLNAGFNSNSSNKITFQTQGSSERLRITNDGNVGIGTTSPDTRLHVSSSSGFSIKTERAIQDAGRDGFAHFYTAGGAHIFGHPLILESALRLTPSSPSATTKTYRFNNDSSILKLQLEVGGGTQDANILSVSSSNIGIGTASPSQKLDVNGNVIADTYYVANTANYIDIATGLRLRSNSDGIRLMPNGTDAGYIKHTGVSFTLPITASGNISASGDGTFNKLFVKDTYALELQATSAGPRIFFGSNTDADAYMSFGAFGGNMNNLDTETRDFHIYGSNTTTGFYFDESAGKFGIGTTTPAEKLTVEGNISASGVLYAKEAVFTDSAGVVIDLLSSTSDSYLRWKDGGTSKFSLGFDNGDSTFAISTGSGLSNNQAFTIKSDGNIGIGTTAPGHLLEVRGTGDALSVGDDTNTQTYMRFANERTQVGYSGANAVFQGGLSKGIRFNVNNNSFNSGNAMAILADGNVGIGTDSPAEKLTVAGDISASGDIHTQDKFVVRGSAGLIKIENPSWTTAGNHDILYNGWDSDVDDYVYLKAGGNSTSLHGIIAISDTGGFFVGNTNTETGGINPNAFDRLDFRVDASGNITASGNISASGTTTTQLLELPSGTAGSKGINLGTHTHIYESGGLNFDGGTSTRPIYFRINGTKKLELDTAGNITASGDIVLQGTAPSIRIQDTRNLNNPDWDGVSLGNIEFYSSDTTSPGARVLAEIEAFSNNAAASGPNSDLIFKTSENTDSSPQTRLTIGYDGTATFTGNIVGTLGTAAQTNITSLGTLTGLTINGNLLLENNKEIRQKDTGGTERTLFELDNSNDLNLGGSFAGSLKIIGGGSYSEIARFDDNGHFVQVSGKNLTTTHITASGNISASGNLETDQIYLGDKILHSGDTNTYIAFEDNTHRYFAEGEEMIKFNSSKVTINEAAGNNDLQIKGNTDNNLLYTDGSADKVGIGTASPGEKLEVNGNILADSYKISNVTVLAGSTNVALGSSGATGTISLNTHGGTIFKIDGNDNILIRTGSASVVGGTARMTVDVGSGTSSPISIVNGATDGMYIRRYDSSGKYQIQTTVGSGNSGVFSLQTYGGNVGIGTSSPAEKLHVEGDSVFHGDIQVSGSEANIKFNRPNGSLVGAIGWDNSDVFYVGGHPDYGPTAGNLVKVYGFGNDLRLGTNNGGDALTVDGTNIGIGTTGPGEKLTVHGNISASGNLSVNEITASADLHLTTANIFTPAGTVDFFAPGGSAKSTRAKSGQFSTAYSGTIPDNGILFSTDTTLQRTAATTLTLNGRLIANSLTSGDITDAIDVTTKMTLTANTLEFLIADDNILELEATKINASKPIVASSHITASGNISASGNIYAGAFTFSERFRTTVAGTEGFAAIYLNSDSNTGLFQPGADTLGFTTAGSEALRITSAGNVGIGETSPSAKLVVKGADSAADFADYGIAAFENQQNEGLSIGYDTGDNYSYLYSREVGVSSRGLRLNGSIYVAGVNGNVGIGTTSPGEKLTVEGNISASGNITASGLFLPQLGTIEWLSAAGQRQTIKGTDNYIQIDGDNRVLVAADTDMTITSPLLSTSGNFKIADDSTIGNNTYDDILTLESDGNALFTYTAQFEDDVALNGKTTINKRRFNKTTSSDGNAQGDVVYFGGTTSMTIGRIYHYKSDGTWELANPNSAATSDGLLGVALGTSSDSHGVLLRGMVTLDHDPGTVGDVLFLNEQQVSSAYGAATNGAPAGSGDIVRVIGYCLDSTNGQIYFNPDGAFVEVA